ncbi:MAG TPA: STAS domain-containing protein [Burkholderiaceae bacterium]|jgi:ABC-type transporter Mla MlaB component|nr:STAS domain-containing protein [Burkholderiaceae bacterium]
MPDPSAGAAGGAAPEVALPARVAYDNAPALLDTCGQSLAAGTSRFDLAACADFDSSLIGILLELMRRSVALGRPLQLLNPPPNLRKLAELYGVHSLLFKTDEPA